MHDLLIGTRDWQNTPWAEKFYPENLPDDWRFCFYSNQFRTVLVPGTVWKSVTNDDINTWIEDSDDEFKIICELPVELSEAYSVADAKKLFLDFQDKTSLLDKQISAYFWQPGDKQLQQPEFMSAALKLIADVKPVSLLVTGKQPALMESNLASASISASLCWSVAESEKPAEQGQFLVALCQENDLKRIRVVIEQLQDWMGEKRQAALIFEGDNALVQAQQARMIAEMLVV
jgi:hypothetical protein